MARFSSRAQAGTSPQMALEIESANTEVHHGSFVRRGQSWFCASGLPSDIIVEVDEMLFHLHQLPLTSRSGTVAKMVADAISSDDNEARGHPLDSNQKLPRRICRITLDGMFGGPDAFALAAKFCYGVKVELMANNVAALRCVAEYLQMSEEYGEHNLISLTEDFLDNIIIKSWKDSVKTLKTCEPLLPVAEELCIVKKCVDSIATKICTEPSLYGWPTLDQRWTLQSPSGRLLWSGNLVKGRGRDMKVDWWYEDVSVLNLPLFKCIIRATDDKGLLPEAIAGALMYYARKSIPGMNRRQEGSNGHSVWAHSISSSNAEQLFCLETIESLLPLEKGMVPTIFLSSLLKVAMILNAEKCCLENLEKRIGAQLEHAVLDDILIPNYSELSETLYDVDCVERIVKHFVNTTKALVLCDHAHQPYLSSSSSAFPLVAVSKLVDAYSAEIASDVNLEPAKFLAILESLPHDARVLDDSMYQAIDIYLKSHPCIDDAERDILCNLISCDKLTQQACTHAAQNRRLPLRIVAQVLFLEQMQLRAALTGALEAATTRTSAAESLPALENMNMPHTSPMLTASYLANEETSRQAAEMTQIALRADLTILRHRIAELEHECIRLRQRLQRKAVGWNSISSKLSCHSLTQVQLPSTVSTNPRRRKSASSIASIPHVVDPRKSH